MTSKSHSAPRILFICDSRVRFGPPVPVQGTQLQSVLADCNCSQRSGTETDIQQHVELSFETIFISFLI